MRTPCPTLSDLRWTIKWPTMINDPDWSVEIWMLFLTALLITINNSYLARAAHCSDKSSQLMGSPIKCSWHWCRDCSEYAGSDLNTHHPNCLNTATDNVLCHTCLSQSDRIRILHECHKQWTWTLKINKQRMKSLFMRWFILSMKKLRVIVTKIL